MLNGMRISKVVDTIDQARELRDKYKAGEPQQAPDSLSVGDCFGLYKHHATKRKWQKARKLKTAT